MKVEVYWNLNKNCFSVRHKGKVIDHTQFVLLRDIKWVVQPGGRARVLKTRRKNVHAFARGTLLTSDQSTPHPNDHDYKRIIYDPYEYDSFVTLGTKTPVYESDFARLSTTYHATHNFYGPRVAVL
tara:strand:- start:12152 stop:12529 length:378 start_codon:yes stop_codon:yes gene_type:complete